MICLLFPSSLSTCTRSPRCGTGSVCRRTRPSSIHTIQLPFAQRAVLRFCDQDLESTFSGSDIHRIQTWSLRGHGLESLLAPCLEWICFVWSGSGSASQSSSAIFAARTALGCSESCSNPKQRFAPVLYLRMIGQTLQLWSSLQFFLEGWMSSWWWSSKDSSVRGRWLRLLHLSRRPTASGSVPGLCCWCWTRWGWRRACCQRLQILS